MQGAWCHRAAMNPPRPYPARCGGTKCPSMMSMWMTSACCSTSLTCSARWARSAERIDAASLPTRPMVLGGLRLPGEGGDEHPIAPVPMGPQSNPGRSAVRAVHLHRLQVGPMADDGIGRCVGLGAREGAHRVDEPASRLQQIGECCGDRHLGARQLAELILAIAPQQLGPPARRPQARARCIDHDSVEGALQGGMLGILGQDESGAPRA